MKEFVDAVKRLVDLMPSGAALPHFYAHDELVKVRELLGEMQKPDPREVMKRIGDTVHAIDLDENRTVMATEAEGGIFFVFHSNGIEERVALSYEAIDAVIALREHIRPFVRKDFLTEMQETMEELRKTGELQHILTLMGDTDERT